ncbi:MAG: hypothetical protein KGN77_05050 [Xanthomonadaceae bacterium]|nr:hypothetical protein [Xanthomonadaceae bacterium]
MPKTIINKWPVSGLSGAKRANIAESEGLGDWFVGHGKTESCQFEGTWWDMICFARNVLASVNTKIAAPSFYMPELANDNYTGPTPYEYDKESNPGDQQIRSTPTIDGGAT